MAYPTLTILPTYPISEKLLPSSIKTQFEAGYLLARSRHSRDRLIFQLNYKNMGQTDKDSLFNHMKTVKDVDTFSWTHPVTSTVYTVRYEAIPEFQLIQVALYNVSFALIQV
jgi:hypothetical protein